MKINFLCGGVDRWWIGCRLLAGTQTEEDVMCTVVNKYKEEYDVYIGRGSRWGNPFTHRKGTKAEHLVASREEAIEAYRKYLWEQIQSGEVTKQDLLDLDGKRLGCFCKPQACHGDVIARAVEWAKS